MNKLRLLFLAVILQTGLSASSFAQTAFSDPSEQSNGGSGLVAVEPDLDSGSLPVGSTSQIIVRFRNDGSVPVEFRKIDLYPSSTVSAGISSNECAKDALPGGAECAVILSVKGLQPGNWRTEILVRHTGPSRLVAARVNGTVAQGDAKVNIATDIEVTPSPVDFGELEDSRPIIRSVTVRNITSEPITISDMYIDAPKQSGYNLRSNCSELVSGQACVASILWSPVVEGPSSGFLVVEHNGPSRIMNIPLSGEFTPGVTKEADIFPASSPGKGVLISSETEIDFGSGINAQSAITVSLVNAGDAVLSLNEVKLAGSENGLKLIKNGCSGGMVLEPTEACPLTISWAPTKIGSVIDDVQIYHSGARGVLVLPVRGTASEAISLDSKPIIISQDMNPSGSSGNGGGSSYGSRQQPVLDGYIVTSHAAKHAIIRGPIGSRIVADGKTTLIGGYEWNVEITDMGVKLSNGDNVVILIFDRSLTNNSPVQTSGGGTVSSTTVGASN